MLRLVRTNLQLLFSRQICELRNSLISTRGALIVTNDFNSKYPGWGQRRLNRQGCIVSDLIAGNDLVAFSSSSKVTFRKRDAGSIIDLTLASSALAKLIQHWAVLNEESFNDHRYVEFELDSLGESSRRNIPQATLTGMATSWNRKKLNVEKLIKYLEEEKLIAEL